MPEDATRCIRCGFELKKASVLSAGVQPPATVMAPSTRQASVTEPGAVIGDKRVQRVGSKEILIAVFVVAIMLSLAWLKETGNVYGAIAFSGLGLAALVSNFVLMHRRRQETEEKGTTHEPRRMPKQIKLAVIAVVVALLIEAVYGSARVVAIAAFVNGLLLYLIVKRNNWARWMFVVLTGLVVVSSIPALFAKFGSELLSAVFDTLQTTLLAVAIILLVTRPVSQWFRTEGDQAEQALSRDG